MKLMNFMQRDEKVDIDKSFMVTITHSMNRLVSTVSYSVGMESGPM